MSRQMRVSAQFIHIVLYYEFFTTGHQDLLYPLSLQKQLSTILHGIGDAVGTIPWVVDKDLDEAGLALARLQYVYRLDTQDLMNGVIGTVFLYMYVL